LIDFPRTNHHTTISPYSSITAPWVVRQP
jgi:hypothetical protein